MTTKKATDARANLYGLIDETNASHEPILITGKRANAVLVGEDDWRSIQETLYLLSIPGMRESIRKGLKTPLKECSQSRSSDFARKRIVVVEVLWRERPGFDPVVYLSSQAEKR